VKSAASAPLPDLSAERLVERLVEALHCATDPARLASLPPWVRRVMRILKEQFVPPEYTPILAGEASVFAEGVAVAWAARARDLGGTGTPGFAARLAERFTADQRTREVATQVEAGTFTTSPELQAHVARRVLAADAAERRAFIDGLAIGHRLPELLDRQTRRGTTDATRIYLLLWLYWPEIARLHSLPEVAQALAPFFADNRNLAGAHWDERIRKLGNRLGLSFRTQRSPSSRPRRKK
jgi:hypothetical protein